MQVKKLDEDEAKEATTIHEMELREDDKDREWNQT
jgi:hypothetical protein